MSYLLSLTHPDGRHKARYFLRLGFRPDDWEQFASALQRHAAEHEIARQDDTPFGTWYNLEGEIEAPRGDRPRIRTVWMLDRGATVPRLVTAYPIRGGRR